MAQSIHQSSLLKRTPEEDDEGDDYGDDIYDGVDDGDDDNDDDDDYGSNNDGDDKTQKEKMLRRICTHWLLQV